MVENANKRFKLFCVIAISEDTITVKPAIQLTTEATSIDDRNSVPNTPVNTRMMQNTPTFTTATACNSADTGVGATIALGNYEWKGMIPALAKPKTNSSKRNVTSVPLSAEVQP